MVDGGRRGKDGGSPVVGRRYPHNDIAIINIVNNMRYQK